MLFSVLFTLYDCNVLFTSNLMFLSSAYLSVELQSNVAYLNVGPPNLCPALVGSILALEWPLHVATAVARTLAFTASIVACGMACVVFV